MDAARGWIERARQVTNFTTDHIRTLPWSPDGKTLAVVRGHTGIRRGVAARRQSWRSKFTFGLALRHTPDSRHATIFLPEPHTVIVIPQAAFWPEVSAFAVVTPCFNALDSASASFPTSRLTSFKFW